MAMGGLSGWKQIADHLGTSVRTAQRYEQDLGLPVHRLPAPASGVLADTGELDGWRAGVMASAERRAAMERAEHEALAEREARAEPDGAEDADPGLPDDTAPSGVGEVPAAGRHRGRLVVLVAAIVVAGAVPLWVRLAPSTPAGSRAAVAPPSGAVQVPLVTSPILDPGPWPTDGHDMQRTNQAHLQGPRAPGVPRLIHQLDPRQQLWHGVAVAVTMDGRITSGECGSLVSIARSGRLLWRRELRAYNGLPVRPGGLTAAAEGSTYFGAYDCALDPDIVQSHLRTVSREGVVSVVRDIGSSFHSPALSPSRTVYTIDEINFVRAFRLTKEVFWGTTLASFGGGGISLDATGRLYVGTDGGLTHQPSLWALAPDGEVRWSALRDELGQTVIGSDRLYVASMTGHVYAFSLDGRQLWSIAIGAIGSLKPLALARSGTLYVQTARDLVSLNPDGTVKWRVGPAAPLILGSARPLLDHAENVYATAGDAVVSFTPEGRERWRVPVPKPAVVVMLDEGALLVMTAEGKLYEIADRITP
jgi:outer membrane protein assembly factor BamB